MPVCTSLSGSSLNCGEVSKARRRLAASLVSQAPPGNWNVALMPTAVAYQSIISCRRVVFRLTWCRVGRMMALPSAACDIYLLLWCCLGETHRRDASHRLLEKYPYRTLAPAHDRSRITGLRMRPMRSISTSTTSPSCKKRGGVRLNPTSDGVPVAMISPGSSVMRELRKAIEVATEKSMLAVLSCCTTCPFTLVVSMSVCGSGMLDAGTIPDPIGAKVSRALPAVH